MLDLTLQEPPIRLATPHRVHQALQARTRIPTTHLSGVLSKCLSHCRTSDLSSPNSLHNVFTCMPALSHVNNDKGLTGSAGRTVLGLVVVDVH
jgi:hypothetical protein